MRMDFVRPKEEPKPYKYDSDEAYISYLYHKYKDDPVWLEIELAIYKQNKKRQEKDKFKYDFFTEEKKEQSLEQKVDMLVEENKKLLQTIDYLKSEIERLTNLYSEQEFVPETKKESIQKVKKM